MDAVAETEGSGERTGRAVARGWRHPLGAVGVALAVTAAVVVPMGYQARAAREPVGGTPVTTPDTTPGTVPTEVLGSTLTPDQLASAPAQVVQLEFAVNLKVSNVSPDRSLSRLHGAVLENPDAWVVAHAPDAVVVRFWLNDPTGSGPPDQVDPVPPFTLGSGPPDDTAAPLDVAALPPGVHTVLAELTKSDGAVEYQRASFIAE